MLRVEISFNVKLGDELPNSRAERIIEKVVKQIAQKIPEAVQYRGSTQSLLDDNGDRIGSFRYFIDYTTKEMLIR